eukprot:TRINITY_DN9820_c0_g1_i2.p1 TRINITY_DN9820_c0_g1~~TRINITY_DN9820_c0_g1_i2.p1  ORF type:complete len:1131 (+),score=264.70 TRINITY_DN9820_c0_g1_i2:38-3394(+)
MAKGKKRKQASDAATSEQDAEKPAKAAKGGGAEVFRAPEASEVLEIAKTRNLYKSNLFRLQLEELLKELLPRKAQTQLEVTLRALRAVLLEKLQPREIPADFASEYPALSFHQIGGPSPSPMPFLPPKRVDVVGSFLLGTYLKGGPEVDLSLEMPSEMFRSKDYLNFRYHDKRAAFVGEVYRQLSGGLLAGEESLAGLVIDFEALHGDTSRPCITLRPGKAGEERWAVRLLPAYNPEVWLARMLAPERNAVRPQTGAGGDKESEAKAAAEPTPCYNSDVLQDARMRHHLEALHKALQRVPALRDAVLLLKRWACACGFMAQSSGLAVFTPLNGFVLSMLAAHTALSSSVAPAQTSSFQLFKLALSVLASTEWISQKVVFGKAGTAALSDAERRGGSAHFYDAESEGLNIFARLGPFMEEVQWEAKRALRILDSEADPFEAVFGRRVLPELVWDLVLRTPPFGMGALCPDLRTDSASGSTAVPSPVAELPADEPQALAAGSQLRAVLQAGLGDRCIRAGLRLVGDTRLRWKSKLSGGGVAVMVGLVLDPQNLERALDRGPSAQDQAAAERFRDLWGPKKSELRRFKDGSILECAVWSKPPAERKVESRKQPAVVTQIVRHLLARHLRPPSLAAKTDLVAGPVGFVTNLGKREQQLWATFETFRTHLCQLSSLPLTIKDIHPVDASFSYTEVLPCLAPPAASGSDSGLRRTLHNVVLEFESSGRWPDEPAAARKVAGALLLQIREEMASDLGIESDATEMFLDVRYPDAVFRLQVFHPHELTEVANQVASTQGGVQPASTPPSEEAVARLRSLWWRPRLRASLHAYALQQPAFAGAVRLCKRWMASQMLSGYDEFVEHLVAAVFLHPSPFEVPTSPQVGFCRFCRLLESFDWQREPLVIDIDGKLKEEERLFIRQSFEKHREGTSQASAAVGLWVATRLDPHAMLLASPPATVAAWLRQRARHALAACGRRLSGKEEDWRAVFHLDTSAFDLMLRLLPLPEDQDADLAAAKANSAAKRLAVQLVSQEAAEELVRGLRSQLSPVCLVLHDAQNQRVAIKWRPSAFLPQPQNVLMGAMPHTVIAQGPGEAPLCVPNVLCIASDIASLAQDLALEANILVSQA